MAEPSLVVEKNVATAIRDGVVLRADVYRPTAAGKGFTKLLGARVLFEYFVTRKVAKSAQLPEKLIILPREGRQNSSAGVGRSKKRMSAAERQQEYITGWIGNNQPERVLTWT